MDQSKPPYKLTHVTHGNNYDVQRGNHKTKQVHYILADGTKDYIEVPADMYTAENIHQLIEQAAAEHARVMSIQPGQPTPPPTTGNDPWNMG